MWHLYTILWSAFSSCSSLIPGSEVDSNGKLPIVEFNYTGFNAMDVGELGLFGCYFHYVSGVLVPTFILQEEVDKMKDMELYPDDVWIVSYPKCGTTWTQQIVRLIHNKGIQDDVKLWETVPWLEAVARWPVDVKTLPRPRAFKSHSPYHAFPCGPPHTTPCKYICVMRNPKDVAVSFYRQLSLRMEGRIDWKAFWKIFIPGELYGGYFDHTLGWWEHRNDRNVLILKYEDMKRNLTDAVTKIAQFLEVELSTEVITKIADLTTFESMKNDRIANMSWVKELKNSFMHKGEVGDWKNYLTPEESAQIDALCAEKFKDTGIEFDFE